MCVNFVGHIMSLLLRHWDDTPPVPADIVVHMATGTVMYTPAMVLMVCFPAGDGNMPTGTTDAGTSKWHA